MNVAAEGRSLVIGSEQLVSDRVTAPKQPLEEAQATLARQRERKAASQRQWRERHLYQPRGREAAYRRER